MVISSPLPPPPSLPPRPVASPVAYALAFGRLWCRPTHEPSACTRATAFETSPKYCVEVMWRSSCPHSRPGSTHTWGRRPQQARLHSHLGSSSAAGPPPLTPGGVVRRRGGGVGGEEAHAVQPLHEARAGGHPSRRAARDRAQGGLQNRRLAMGRRGREPQERRPRRRRGQPAAAEAPQAWRAAPSAAGGLRRVRTRHRARGGGGVSDAWAALGHAAD